MALDNTPTTYLTGTASIAANGKALTGTGTAWDSAGLRPGDRLELRGLTARIASINSATSITLALPWPGGAVADSPYSIERIDSLSRAHAALTLMTQSIAEGSLAALQGLVGEAGKLPVFTGPNAMELVDRLIPQASNGDATAGRALVAGKAFGIGGDAPILEPGTNMATVVRGGIYRVTQNHGNPVGMDWGLLFVMQQGDVCCQTLVNAVGETFQRFSNHAHLPLPEWQEWQRLFRASDAMKFFGDVGPGKLLTYGSLGFGTQGENPPGNDWNNGILNGAIYMSSGGANAPDAFSWWIGTYYYHAPGFGTQVVYSFTIARVQVHIRSLVDNVWQAWNDNSPPQYYLTPNGRAVMHADGTLECWHELAFPPASGGPEFRQVVWTFPWAFIARPVVTGNSSIFGNTGSFVGASGGSLNALSGTFGFDVVLSGVGEMTVGVRAIGRWK